jgi:hypothetical protein
MLLRVVERFRLVLGMEGVVSRFKAQSSVLGLVGKGSELDDDWSSATFFLEKGPFGCKESEKIVSCDFDWLEVFLRFLSDVLLLCPCRKVREV